MKPSDIGRHGEAQVGRPRRRVEDDALLTGAGCFVGDRAPAGCLHLAFIRSPHARARIAALNADAALAMPGVARVLTARDLGPIGPLPVNGTMIETRVANRHVLAREEVRYVGEPVAAVIAESIDVARDATESIEVEFHPETPALDLGEGAEEAFRHQWSAGDVEAAFAGADEVVALTVEQPRVAPAPLEPRATLASWDAERGELTVWLSSQAPHRARDHLAKLLRLDPRSVRVVVADVGGAFGGKASIYPEDLVVAWAAREVRRPVKWVAARGEDLVSASHGRGARLAGELALKRDGTLLGLRARLSFPLGAWMPFSAVVPAWNAGRILPGPYRVPALQVLARGVIDDAAPVGIYRGAGRPEAAMLMERLVDEAARAIGMDPADLRRRNLIPPDRLPYATPTGEKIDSGAYPELLEKALLAGDYRALCEERSRRRATGKLYGIGIAFYIEPCGRGSESARIRLEADGRVLVASGTTPQGQGHRTTFAQIAADELGVPFEAVQVLQGDTRTAPAGIGALASRSTAIGGSAVLRAARLARERQLACEPLPIEVSIEYAAEGEAWSSGCCIAAVSIDRDTGELAIERFAWADDAGVVINPLLVEGQLSGGFAQGLGQALLERLVYDAEGQLLTGSLMDYAVPRATDIPGVRLAEMQTPSPANALGAKGVGESGAIGVPPAIVNAAVDALNDHGVRHLDVPLTSEKLWQALHQSSRDCGVLSSRKAK
ncbi:MAG: xanthine dehydrogenase family protein molybdopterin-binding subunit [Betaproteobacteria bacterium]